MKKRTYTVKIKGIKTDINELLRYDIVDYKIYTETGNMILHDEMLRTSNMLCIELMESNKIIIRRNRRATTIYISNEELMSSFQMIIFNKDFTGISMDI